MPDSSLGQADIVELAGAIEPPGAVRWLFGKMPAHGDFVARGLDAAHRDALDHWLTREMAWAQANWPDDFDARFEAAPAWHFVWRAADGAWIGGVLCASTDRVGRRFPLIMAAPAQDCRQAAGVSAGCLDVLVNAFTQGWDADMLNRAQVTPADMPWQPENMGWALVGEDGPVVELAGHCPDGIVVRMLEFA